MKKIASKIFIDGGVPEETKQVNASFLSHFGYPLDGQTTNPTLIAKNLQSRGESLTESSALKEYKRIVQDISHILPKGSVSIQVFANKETTTQEMITQARERMTWVPNASIKLPCTPAGIQAAETLCKETPINITLVFSQSQAAAVYEATKKASYPVFLSPFVGRLDDRGENGMQLIKNILTMYASGDNHVETLTASIRTLDHILYALYLQSPILTIPAKAFMLWQETSFSFPSDEYQYLPQEKKPIPYEQSTTLGKPWESYDLSHDLTYKGLEVFWNDWKSLIQ